MKEPVGRWGRYELPNPNTGEMQSWTRASTLAKVLDSEYGLNNWKMRNVILGLVSRPDLLDLAYASDPEDKQQLDELCEKALDAAKADMPANRGTALHKLTARLDSGVPIRSRREWEPDLDAYRDFKDREGIITHPKMIERITVVPELECAGKFDRIVKHGGEPKIADLKTGGLDYAGVSISIQLAIYSRGKGLWNLETGKWEPMPNVSQTEGLVIHLPPSYDPNPELVKEPAPELRRVDLELGWKMAEAAYWVYNLRKNKELLRKDS